MPDQSQGSVGSSGSIWFNMDDFNMDDFNMDDFNMDDFNMDDFNISDFNIDEFNMVEDNMANWSNISAQQREVNQPEGLDQPHKYDQADRPIQPDETCQPNARDQSSRLTTPGGLSPTSMPLDTALTHESDTSTLSNHQSRSNQESTPDQPSMSNPTQPSMCSYRTNVSNMTAQQRAPTQQIPYHPLILSKKPARLMTLQRLWTLRFPSPFNVLADGTVVRIEGHTIVPLRNAAIWIPFDVGFFENMSIAKVFSRWKIPNSHSDPPIAERLFHHDKNAYQHADVKKRKMPGRWWFVANDNVVIIFSDDQESHKTHCDYMAYFLGLQGLALIKAVSFGSWDDMHLKCEPVLGNNKLLAWLVFDMLADEAMNRSEVETRATLGRSPIQE